MSIWPEKYICSLSITIEIKQKVPTYIVQENADIINEEKPY